MAGTAKPTVADLKREVKTTIRGFSLANGTLASYLFNGVSAYAGNYKYTTADFSPTSYIELSISEACNIWRCGFNDYPQCYNQLKIYVSKDNSWVEVSSLYNLPTTSLKNNQWEMFIKSIPAGIYRIGYNNQRVDSEWYCEFTEILDKFLIKMDNKFYNIDSKYYNTIKHMYDNLSDGATIKDGFTSIEDLFKPILIGEETFKPIDKFNNFQIISPKEIEINIKAIKSSKELIVPKDNVLLSDVGNINYIESFYTNSGNGEIKMVFSIDDGKTWITHNCEMFLNIPITIPIKKYNEMTNDEKIQLENAKQEIAINGIKTNILKDLDFNILDIKQIRFAYVLLRPKYTDMAQINETKFQFNKKDFGNKMKDTEYELSIHDRKLNIVSLINNSLVTSHYIYKV